MFILLRLLKNPCGCITTIGVIGFFIWLMTSSGWGSFIAG